MARIEAELLELRGRFNCMDVDLLGRCVDLINEASLLFPWTKSDHILPTIHFVDQTTMRGGGLIN
jgi:hypothetical protein